MRWLIDLSLSRNQVFPKNLVSYALEIWITTRNTPSS
jgi:hypothetical protein